jgi:hypothetical protein
MLRLRLPADDTSLLLAPQWSGLPTALQVALLALLAAVPLALVAALYRYELKLVPRAVALVLLGLRVAVLALIVFLVGFQPVYARDVKFDLPGRILVAVDRSDSTDVADPQRTPAEKLRLARALKLAPDLADDATLDGWIKEYEDGRGPRWAEREAKQRPAHDAVCKRVDELTRSETARRVLAADGVGLLPALAKQHDVKLLGFHRETWELKPDQLAELFAKAEGGAAYTDLRLPLVRALEQPSSGDRKVLGVVLLTDGQHNYGEPPVRKAIELGERQIPVFPVALGARRPPPDVAVSAVKAPHNVFKDVDAPIEVRFKVTGLSAQNFKVELSLDGAEKKLLEERVVRHDGKDQEYAERFTVRLDKPGTQTLTAKVTPLDPNTRETRTDNNSKPAVVNVADDKAKVLLIDGEARWEYHYLASALQRDRTMKLTGVVFDQPRLNKDLTPEELEKIGSPRQQMPAGPDALADFDCVILGDATAAQLPLAERVRLEKYVADRGGTLVILAGKRAMPLGYPDLGPDGEGDPLRKLLPIEEPQVVAPADGFPVTLTQDGKDAEFMKLDADGGKSVARWAELPRHYWGVVGKAKPGAVVLAYVEPEASGPAAKEREKERALIVRHNYGFGRVLYVGLDSTWRWRYKVGDTYHHRFWGQAIRWAAADKPLVSGNEYLRFGTPQPLYRQGEEAELVVRLNDEAGTLKPDALAAARVIRTDGKEETVALVPLGKREAQPRVLEGKLANLPAGRYAVELVIPDLAGKLDDPASRPGERQALRATFAVLPPDSTEMIDLGTNWAALEELAAKSGGQVYTPEDAAELLTKLAAQSVPHTERRQQALWQWWVMLVLVVVLLTGEWAGRKWAGLP